MFLKHLVLIATILQQVLRSRRFLDV